MPSICARKKFKPLHPQSNAREAETCRFTARRLRLICLLLMAAASPLLRAQEEEPVHVLPPSRFFSTTDAAGPVDVRSRVFISLPNASGSKVHNVLYAALKRSGEFQLVNDPALADQIFEIDTVDSEYSSPDKLFPDYSIYLNILDSKGRFLRGPYTVKVKSARLERNVEKNLRQAIDTLVRQISPEEIPAGIRLASQGDERTQPPAPAAFSRVKTVFIAEVQDKTSAMSAKAPSDFYKMFYAAMQKWGRYKLLPSSEGADLLIDVAVSMHSGQDFKDQHFVPQAEVRMTLASSNLVYGYNMPLRWGMLGSPFGLKLLTSQKALRQSAEILMDELRRLTARADAAEGSGKVGVQ